MPLSFVIMVATTVLIGVLFVRAIARADRTLTTPAIAFFAAIMIMDGVLGLSGVLLNFERMPPPFAMFFLFNIGVTAFVSFSRFGDVLIRSLSWSQLVGYQSFRILAEILLFVGLQEGLTPVQMTFEGYNFDIVTGVSALALGVFLRKRENLLLIKIWNTWGLIALAVIAFIALTSLPLPFRVFMNEPTNVWVGHFPYTWLPGILVTAAMTGHVLVIRKLRLQKSR